MLLFFYLITYFFCCNLSMAIACAICVNASEHRDAKFLALNL